MPFDLQPEFLYAPDEGAAGAGAPAAPDSGDSSVASGSSPDGGAGTPAAPPPSSLSTDTHAGPGEGGSQEPSSPTSSAFWDSFSPYGIKPEQFNNDERAAAAYLATQIHQRGELERQVRYFQQQVLQQQQAAYQPPAAPAAEKKWWNPPEYRPEWDALVRRDPQTGEFQLAPGAPPDILPKYLAHKQYQQDFAQKFLRNPEEAIGEMIDARAKAQAQAIVQQHLQGYQDNLVANQVMQQHRSWMIAQDPFTGRDVLTDWGRRFYQHLEALDEAGVKDERLRANYALSLIQADAVRLKQQQALPQAAAPGEPVLNGAANGAAARDSYLKAAQQRKPNRGSTSAPTVDDEPGGNAFQKLMRKQQALEARYPSLSA